MTSRVRSLLSARSAAVSPGQCTRETKRCVFWSWGPGYLRPDCCTSHLLELTDFVHELLDEHGILHWVDWGTLLGAVRGGELIPWDSDVDLGVLDRDAERVRALDSVVARAGHVMQVDDPELIRIQYSEVNEAHLDLFIWSLRDGLITSQVTDDYTWLGMNGRTDFPAHYLDRLEPVTAHGRNLPAPSPTPDFLREHRYGPDYMTPTRPILALGLDDAIKSSDMTPAATELLPRIALRSERLVDLARSRSLLMRKGIVEPAISSWGVKWQLVAGLPLKPEKRHVDSAWNHASANDGPAVEKLVVAGAWIERCIEEYESPPRLVRVRRMYRRMVRLALALHKRRSP